MLILAALIEILVVLLLLFLHLHYLYLRSVTHQGTYLTTLFHLVEY